MRRGDRIRCRQAGFTYLAALFLVALLGAALAATGMLWSTANQRQKERELMFVGDQFRLAIKRYYEGSPGTLKKYPMALSDLLQDERQLSVQRYLRRVYADPISGAKEWGLVQSPEGGVMGVFSLSEMVPLKQAGFDETHADFANAKHYSDWKFVYRPPMPVAGGQIN